jgi:hypothetical protein
LKSGNKIALEFHLSSSSPSTSLLNVSFASFNDVIAIAYTGNGFPMLLSKTGIKTKKASN